MDHWTLTPAYGRDYKSRAALLADWEAGKDFQMQPQGCYCSIRDAQPGQRIQFRYKQLRETFIHTCK